MKRSKFIVVSQYKCPQCHEGDMFVKPFKATDPLNMNKNCNTCNLDFEQEPGFYYGAMFISYIITILLMLDLAGVFLLGFNLSENVSMLLILLVSLLLFFKLLRGSRAIWLGMTVKYNPGAIEKFKKN